jgi:tetratricopeptide (TPR) repeat protein
MTSFQLNLSRLLAVLLLIGCTAFAWRPLAQLAHANWFALQVLRAALGEPERLVTAYAQLVAQAPGNPRADWFLGLLAGKLGDPALQQVNWSRFLSGPLPEALSLVHAGGRDNLTLAQQATKVHPEQAESWFWIAQIFEQSKRNAEALQTYQRVVQLDPENGLAWCHLGYLLRGQKPLQARDAYLQC